MFIYYKIHSVPIVLFCLYTQNGFVVRAHGLQHTHAFRLIWSALIHPDDIRKYTISKEPESGRGKFPPIPTAVRDEVWTLYLLIIDDRESVIV